MFRAKRISGVERKLREETVTDIELHLVHLEHVHMHHLLHHSHVFQGMLTDCI